MDAGSIIERDEDAERLRWLRDGKSHFGGYCGSAPFVMDPNRSRLYAVSKLRGSDLNIAVDTDIIDSKAQELHLSNHVVEAELLPYPVDRFSDEYANVLYREAQRLLGWTDERVAAVEAARKA